MRDSTLKALQDLSLLLISVGQQVQNDTTDVVKQGDHVDVIKHFNHVRLAAEQVKEARELLAKLSDDLSRTTIPDIVRDLKERTGEKPPFNIEGVGRVSISHRWSASMLDKDMGFKWLRSNGLGDIIQETVNAQTLAATAKELSETKNRDLPSEIFKVGQMAFTSITKAK